MSPRARLWMFRLLALAGIPAVLLLGLEGGLRVAGVGHPVSFLIPDAQPGHVRTNPEYLSLFLPDGFDLRPLNFRFAARKPAGALRVVVLGESAAQGTPEPMFGFAQHLRAQLRARHPGRAVEVLNTGVVAINSHVVREIARELARYEPDLFVVYLGNNEVVGPYAPGCSYLSAMPPRWVIRLSIAVRSTRVGQVLERLAGRLAGGDAAPAEWGGMAMFVDTAVRGNDPRLERVYENFRTNLDDVIRAGTDAGAKVVVATLVSNLADSPPFLSVNHGEITPVRRAEWERAFARGRLEWLLENPPAARASLEEALALDPRHAETSWLLGRIALDAGQVDLARRHFLEAQRWDALRFRPDPRLNELIRAAAAHNPAVTLADTALLLGADPRSTAPPTGRELLFEHVHFDWEGNYRVGLALAEAAEIALGGPPRSETGAGWLSRAEAAGRLGYTQHARADVLRLNSYIVQQAPFTNQVTYAEDQARVARELAEAAARAKLPAVLGEAESALRAAVAADPDNPHLARLLQKVLEDRGDPAGALAEFRRGQKLQPENSVLRADEAVRLARLGRFDEAGQVLRRAYAGARARDRLLMLPAFADLFSRSKRLGEGRAFLSEVLANWPASTPVAARIRVLRGRLALQAGDRAAAESDLRAARAADPGNPEALESLVALLESSGRRAEAEAEVLAAAAQQPGNHGNNLRAELIADARGDVEASIRHLRAAMRSGPVNSGVLVRLARKLYHAGRADESLEHLALARRLAVFEGDRATADQMTELIRQIRMSGA